MSRKKIKYVLFTLVWLLLTSELIVRTTMFESLKTKHPQPNWIQDSIFGALPEPESDFRLVDENINKEIQINKYGFYDQSMRLLKPPGYYRIAYVGNISETGYFSNRSGSWIDHCRRMFDEEDAKVEFLNFSLQFPRDDYRNLLLIQEKILKFNPDLIILTASIPLKHNKTRKEQYKEYLIEYDSDSCKSALIDSLESLNAKKSLSKLLNTSYILRAIAKYKIRNANNVSNKSKLWYGMNANITRLLSGRTTSPEIYSFSECIIMLNKLSEKLLENDISLWLLSPEIVYLKGLNPNIRACISEDLDKIAAIFFNHSSQVQAKDAREVATIIYIKLKDAFIPKVYTE